MYFKGLEDKLGFSFNNGDFARARKEGFVAAYKAALGKVLNIDWEDCSVDFDLIEQVVLVPACGAIVLLVRHQVSAIDCLYVSS